MKAPGYSQFQNYQQRSPEQIARDLNVAHDRIRTLTHVRDADTAWVHRELERAQKRIALYGWIGVLFFLSSVLQWLAVVELLR